MRLEGKVALITGAATGVEGDLMGFGGASARLFVQEGAKVVLSDINEEAGQKTVAQIREAGGEAMFIRLDVTREEDWQRAIETTVSTYGKLDILVNNAGTGARGTVEETTEEAWDSQMDVHAKGTFLGTKHAIPEMRKVGGGSIVNISSIYGIVGSPTSTAYHAAKGASRLFTKSAAIQYADREHPSELGASRLCPHAFDSRQLHHPRPVPMGAGPHSHRQSGQRLRHRLRSAVLGVGRSIFRHRIGVGNRRRHDGPIAMRASHWTP